MSTNRTLAVLLAGLLLMVGSGLGGYYWASLSYSESRITRQQPTSPESEDNPDENVENLSDTAELSPQNWKAFLKYEGERRQMLGIKKEYNTVNFRSGPGTDYSIIATPQGGELLKLLDRVGNWYRARLSDGSIGWIHRSLVRILRVPIPVVNQFDTNLPSLKKSTQELIPDQFKKHNRIRVGEPKVRLRRGPGTQFNTIGQLYRYEEARLLGKRNDWYRIETSNGSTAWVRSDLVKPVWLISKDKQKTIEIRTRDLRMGPEYQFRKPTETDVSVKGTLLEANAPWYLVKLSKGNIGWVHEKEVIQLPQGQTESPSDRVRQPAGSPGSTVPPTPQTQDPSSGD